MGPVSDLVTIRAIVGTDPQLTITQKGVSVLKFRAATHERKRDLESGQWVDGPTNWYSISAFRGLAENTMESLAQGDHVVIFGKLQIREFERADGTRGTSADVEAFSVGHDLRFGTSTFTRVRTDTSEIERVSHSESQTDADASWPKDQGQAA
ncbi:single-stranded DNA-binding protein [Arthrobacter sp. S41]|nr:single-stranded DNA-binding protein [Arthrobacter sp. S41]